MSLLCSTDWLPELSLPTQAFVRGAYGVLLLGTLVRALPHGRRFFQSERWGGYAKSSVWTDVIQNPWVYPLLMASWLTAAVLLILGVHTVLAGLVNLLLCYYFFIAMRWQGVLRGMGAPGFMSCWLAAAVFLLELTAQHAPVARSLALLVLQVDFALIMFSAGFYKATAGYMANEGMEYGMVNPEWGYWHGFWKTVRSDNPVFWLLNQLGWTVEIVAAVLMLLPATRFLGALLIIFSFAFIATQIRLGLLTQMVMLAGVLYFGPGTIGQQGADSSFSWIPTTSLSGAGSGWLTSVLQGALIGYLVLLPAAHAGLFYNFYTGKRIGRLQRLLEMYTNLFGIIIWRVFSADHTSFFLRIHRQQREGEEGRVLVSDYDQAWGRFNHVAESIVITSVFTSLKYYPSTSPLFRERLLRYARTLPHLPDEVLVFEYVSIRKESGRFVWTPVTEFVVDVLAGTVQERALAEDASCVHSGIPGSPLRQASRPGSYAA